MRKICICDLHHQVLPFWAQWQRKNHTPVTVLTLDHHTDVVRAFRDESIKVPENSWESQENVQKAVETLRHDEHFDWALQCGLIHQAFIASHTCATVPADERLHICCDPAWPDENLLFQEPERFRSLADSVLESDYLFRQFGDPEQYGTYILDIDCDYFLTAKALEPDDSCCFRHLAEQAALITISLESDWVRLLQFRNEALDAGEICKKLHCFFA